ncbi:MAG: GNAT family N-acetyltransferase [Candidatus Heimdallarchaeota archaeon]|nr:GNAT family N-acetyltransferase [Candidatus Heimdallarchaeota archaeon]
MSENGKIIVYEPSMAEKCSDMFNAFNELWPGGFTGAIPFTEQRVRDMLDKTSAVADLIALNSEDEPVGYCGLYPHWRDKNAAYISILGVHPKVLGKKFGKRLLLKALEVAKENKIFRVDLQTWSGNMDAVPLYKKVGLFWVPETSVYMQDFIPGILQNPLSIEWFDKHPDWYGCFKRDLTQAPDKEEIDGMEVFTYNFEVDDDKLSFEVDRYSWGFTSAERILDGNRISIKSRLQSHKIFMGIENSIIFTIENETEADLEIKLNVTPFKGLKWIGEFPESIKIGKGKIAILSNNFIIDHTSRKHTTVQKSSEVIETLFSFDSYDLKLSTGGKIHPAVDVMTHINYIDTPLGIEKNVYLDLKNYTDMALSGKILYKSEGISEDEKGLEFSLQPDEITGINIPLSIPKDTSKSVFILHATPVVKINGSDLQMPEFKIPLVASTSNIAEVVIAPNEERIFLITDFWAIRIELERANIHFRRRYIEDSKVRSFFEIGPPYGLDIDRTLKFDYEVQRNGNELTLVLSGDSIQVEGLRVKKYLRVIPGSKEVEHWIELENISSNGTITAGGRVTTTPGGGLNVNPIGNFAHVYTPIYNRYVKCDPTFPVMTQTLVSDKPEDWHETWTAGELNGESNVSAIIWKPDNIEKIKINQGFLYTLESYQTPLDSGEKVKVVHLWYSHSFSSIRDVRTRWNQLIGQKDMTYDERSFGVQTTPPITVNIKDTNILTKGETTSAILEIFTLTPYPLPGTLTLSLPAGWDGTFVTEEGNKSSIQMPQLVPHSNIPLNVELTIPKQTLKSSDLITLHLSGEFELDFEIPVILKDGSAVQVQGETIEDHDVLVVNNGSLSFTVPKFLGGDLIHLEDAQGNSFLMDSFPNIGPKFFIDHYLGGIQPAIFHPEEGNPFAELEATDAEEITEGEWSGVKVFWINEKSEWLKGQKYAISYLTLPGSNIIRIKVDNINETPRQVTTIAAMIADMALKGETEGNVVKVPGGIGNWIRNRIKKPFINQTNIDEPWVRFSKDDVSLTFLSPEGYYGSNTIFDAQVMLVNILLAYMETAPYQTSTSEFVLILNQPEEVINEVRKGLAKNA